MTQIFPPSPTDDAALIAELEAIETRVAAGNTAGAITRAEAALNSGFAHPRLYFFRAFKFEDLGRYKDAVEDLKRALDTDPDNTDCLISFGFCLIKLNERESALGAFRRAAQVEPDLAIAQYGLGIALRLNGQTELAATAFERVLAIEPGYVAARSALATTAEATGDRDAARRHATQALAQDPMQWEARLVMAKIKLAEKAHDEAATELRTILARAAMEPSDRGDVELTLGDVLDAKADYAAAFEAYRSGKARLRDAFAAVYAAPGREGALDMATRQTRAFAAMPGAAWAPGSAGFTPTAVRTHAFLLGFPRSGTTLLENVLASHPDVATLEERPTLAGVVGEFMTPTDGLSRLAGADDATLDAWRKDYWDRAQRFGGDVSRRIFIDKHPMDALNLPVIARLFPGAKILFALRDPRDVVLSCFRRGFNMNPSVYEFTDLTRTAQMYDATMSAWKTYQGVLGLPVHTVRYEGFITEFDREANDVAQFLGLTWTDDFRKFSETARSRGVRTRSANQVTQGLYADGVAQWRRYAQALATVESILAPWIAEFGYPPG